ncbi:MAG: DNA-binding protein [Bacteroidaceae bacterium]|nr:DNA-binding protein [Bacteroidaceae bacterium]
MSHIRYVKYQNKSQMEGVSGKWYLKVKHTETIELPELAKHMAQHNTSFSRGQILGILTDMTDCMREMMLDGKKIKLSDLAIFSLGVRCKGADKAENATPANIVGIRFNAQGTGENAPAAIYEKVKFKEQDEYSV